MKKLVDVRIKDVLRRMQKATISCSLNIARTFKATIVFFLTECDKCV